MITIKAKRQLQTVFVSVSEDCDAAEVKTRLAEMLNGSGGLVLENKADQVDEVEVPVPSFEVDSDSEAEEPQEPKLKEGRVQVDAEGLRLGTADLSEQELQFKDGGVVAFAWKNEPFNITPLEST
ncbi:hypothetical protein OGAPHI_003034 [Ogataea philodendri]|uniref:Uncharacterized protein n=1 Tax=Ogataea philodendri TaxID=1378263 RepID=A0A9P8T6R8_9ASCO|nr:uncharacterized protein OGAPHI_003034 [Ogataea philodendri]KAH3667385.1 hypothetical protein OGAPHI_003034 [Ogataea philodendri]